MTKCQTVVVQCMDFRIQKAMRSLLESLELRDGMYHLVSVAGGGGSFALIGTHLGLVKRISKGRVSRAILTVHEDCAAGAKWEDLMMAASISSKIGIEPKLFYIKLDGTWKEVNW